MGLSCSCGDEYDWYYEISARSFVTKELKTCYGCSDKIVIGSDAWIVEGYNIDDDGDESSREIIGVICEDCMDMKDNLEAYGFCLEAEDMFVKTAYQEYLQDYLPARHKLSR